VTPTGGLARRASAAAALARQAPALLVDAGDALSHAATLVPREVEGAEARALFVLRTMGTMGYAALAVGEKDLAFGPEWLAREAERAGVPLLSANLARLDGTHPFPATRLVSLGGERVGIVAVSAPGAYPAGLSAGPPQAALREGAAALRSQGATLVVALLHMDLATARQLAASEPGVDVALAAHEGKRQDVEAAGPALLAAPPERGRALGTVVLWPDTRGPWADAGAARKAAGDLASIERSIANAKARLARVTAEADRRALEALVEVQERRAELVRARLEASSPAGRRFDGGAVTLDPTVADDPAVLSEQAALLRRVGAPPAPPGATP